MRRIAGIYRLAVDRPRDDPLCYFGQSSHLLVRRRDHLALLFKGTHYNRALQTAFETHRNVAFRIVATYSPDKALLTELEQAFVDGHPHESLLNVRKQCVVSALGTIATDERKRKIGNAIRGTKHSVETRLRVSAAQAWKRTPEGRKKLSLAQLGRPPLTNETRQKMRRAAMGRIVSDETKKKRRDTRSAKVAATGSVYSPEGLENIRASLKKRAGPLSDETKRKLRAALVGRKRPPEVAKKIAEANRSRLLPADFGQRVSAALKGRRLSKEHCAKLSAVRRGTKRSEETRQKMRRARHRHLLQERSAFMVEFS